MTDMKQRSDTKQQLEDVVNEDWTDNLNLTPKQRDAILRKLYELARNEYITGSMLYQEMEILLNDNTVEEEHEPTGKLPYKREVACYWCELENKNAGLNLPPFNNATCVAKEPFEGKYACMAHGDLLLISGCYSGLLEERQKDK